MCMVLLAQPGSCWSDPPAGQMPGSELLLSHNQLTTALACVGHSSCCSNPDVVDTCKRMSSQPCDAIAAELAKAAVAKGRCAACMAYG